MYKVHINSIHAILYIIHDNYYGQKPIYEEARINITNTMLKCKVLSGLFCREPL